MTTSRKPTAYDSLRKDKKVCAYLALAIEVEDFIATIPENDDRLEHQDFKDLKAALRFFRDAYLLLESYSKTVPMDHIGNWRDVTGEVSLGIAYDTTRVHGQALSQKFNAVKTIFQPA